MVLLNRKKRILLIVLFAVIAGAGAVFLYFHNHIYHSPSYDYNYTEDVKFEPVMLPLDLLRVLSQVLY